MSCIYHQTPTNIVQWPILPAVLQTRDCKIQFVFFSICMKKYILYTVFYVQYNPRIYTFNFRSSQNSADYFFWLPQQNYPCLIIAPIPFWEKAPSFSIGLTEKNLLLGSYYKYWSYKCFDPYFLDQPECIFVNGVKFSNQYD